MQAYINKEIWLPPPQLIELSRLLNFPDLHKLKDFAIERARKGSTLILPVQYICTDGHVALIAGDDMYPSDPHLMEYRKIEKTMQDFRQNVKNVNRFEYVDMNDCTMLCNIELDGHLPPVNLMNFKSNL